MTGAAAKGKRFERELRKGLRAAQMDVESLRLAGAEDEGDMVVRLDTIKRIVVEAKNTVRQDLAGHTGEALAEADHYARHRGLARHDVTAVAVIKRRGKGWKDAYVVTTVREFFHLD